MMEGEKGCRKGRVREENGRGKGGEKMKGEGGGRRMKGEGRKGKDDRG